MPTQHISDLLTNDLMTQDYIPIKNFFSGAIRFDELDIEQQRILDSFSLGQIDDTLARKQDTLLRLLRNEKVLTQGQTSEIREIPKSFSELYKNSKFQNSKWDNNFTNNLTDLVETHNQRVWDKRFDKIYNQFEKEGQFPERFLKYPETERKLAFKDNLGKYLQKADTTLGQRFREDMGIGEVLDLTLPEVPQMVLPVPPVPRHYKQVVRRHTVDLTIPENALDDLAIGIHRAEIGLENDLYRHPTWTNEQLLREYEKIPDSVPSAELDNYLKTRGGLSRYKHNYAVWDRARDQLTDLTENNIRNFGKEHNWSDAYISSVEDNYERRVQSNRLPQEYHDLPNHLQNEHVHSSLFAEDVERGHIDLSDLPFQSVDDVRQGLVYTGPDESAPFLERMPANVRPAIRSYLQSNPEDLILSAEGSLMVDGSEMMSWLGKQIGAMAAVTGVQAAINYFVDHSNLDPKTKQYINLGTSLSVAGLGIMLDPENPLGWIAGLSIPVMRAVAFFSMPHKKRVLNDYPLNWYGRKFGKIRARDKDGNVKWYPAFTEASEEWSVAFAANKTVRFQFGDWSDLYFKSERDGSLRPYFMHPQERQFNITTKEMNDKEGWTKQRISGRKFQKKYDPLRDWVVYSDDDRDELFKSIVTGKDQDPYKDVLDDRSDEGAYTRNLLDLRDGLEFIKKWSFNYGKTDPTDAYSGRGLRRTTQSSGLWDPALDLQRDYGNIHRQFHVMQNLQNAKTPEELTKQFIIEKNNMKENDWLLSYFRKQSRNLFVTQQIGADKSGYRALKKEKGLEQYYYRMYNPDVGSKPAQNKKELESQCVEIYGRNVPVYERDFLSQKAISRYLMNQLVIRGLQDKVFGTGVSSFNPTWSHSDTLKKDIPDDYRGVFSRQQAFVNNKWTGLPSPFSDSNEKNIPDWLRITSTKASYVMGMIIPGNDSDKQILQHQVDALRKYLKTKVVIHQNPIPKKKHTSKEVPKLKPEEPIHKAKYYNQLGEAIIQKKSVFKKPRPKGTKILNPVWKMPYPHETAKKKLHPYMIFDKHGNPVLFDKHKPIKTHVKHVTGTVLSKITPPIQTKEVIQNTRQDELSTYLMEQHGLRSSKNVSWLARDEHGVPTLKSDDVLEEKMQLPSYMRAISKGDEIHMQVDPALLEPHFAKP